MQSRSPLIYSDWLGRIDMYKLILFVFLMSGFMSKGFADINSDVCEFYFRGESSEVRDVQDIFSKVASANAVKICTSKAGGSAYFSASKINVENDVSYFHLTRIFKENAGKKVLWGLIPPKSILHVVTHEVYMCDGSFGCKKQDDSNFVQTEGVAISAFKELSESWDSIVRSDKLFERAIQGLPSRVNSSSSVKELKLALYEKGQSPKLFSLHFNHGDNSTFPKYTFSVVTESNMWNIDFDFHSVSGVQFERVVLVESLIGHPL